MAGYSFVCFDKKILSSRVFEHVLRALSAEGFERITVLRRCRHCIEVSAVFESERYIIRVVAEQGVIAVEIYSRGANVHELAMLSKRIYSAMRGGSRRCRGAVSESISVF